MFFKKKTIYIFGASGHAKELANLASKTHKNSLTFKKAVFVTPLGQEAGTISEDGLDRQANTTFHSGSYAKTMVAVGIGSPRIREKIANKIEDDPLLVPVNLISSSATIPKDMLYLARTDPWYGFNKGIVICPRVTLTVDVRLGKHVHLNTACTICHDVTIGDYSIVSPGATICGKVTIGARCYVGAGAVIKDGISIVDDVTIGAGSVVVKDIDTPGTYVGCPAKFLKEESI